LNDIEINAKSIRSNGIPKYEAIFSGLIFDDILGFRYTKVRNLSGGNEFDLVLPYDPNEFWTSKVLGSIDILDVDNQIEIIQDLINPLRKTHYRIRFKCVCCGETTDEYGSCGNNLFCGYCAPRYFERHSQKVIDKIKYFDPLCRGQELVFTVPEEYYFLFKEKTNLDLWFKLIEDLLKRNIPHYKYGMLLQFQSWSSKDIIKYHPHIHGYLLNKMIDNRELLKVNQNRYRRENPNYLKAKVRRFAPDYNEFRQQYSDAMYLTFGILKECNFYIDDSKVIRSGIAKLHYITRCQIEYDRISLGGPGIIHYEGRKGEHDYEYLDFITGILDLQTKGIHQLRYIGYLSNSTFINWLVGYFLYSVYRVACMTGLLFSVQCQYCKSWSTQQYQSFYDFDPG